MTCANKLYKIENRVEVCPRVMNHNNHIYSTRGHERQSTNATGAA